MSELIFGCTLWVYCEGTHYDEAKGDLEYCKDYANRNLQGQNWKITDSKHNVIIDSQC